MHVQNSLFSCKSSYLAIPKVGGYVRNNYFKEHYNKNIAIPVGGVLLLALVLFFYVSMLPTNAVRNYQNSVSIPHSSVSQSNNLFESSTARFFQKYVSHVPPDSWQLVSGILRADWSNENSSADEAEQRAQQAIR